MKAKHEIEIKLRVDDLREVLRTLRRLGAKCLGTLHERNTLFDTKERDFQRQGSILRIRQERPASLPGKTRRRTRGFESGEGLLTFKGLVTGQRGGKYKLREEIEHRTARVSRLRRILRKLGLRPWFRYEKYRTRYRLRAFPGLEVDLDETPIGLFLELEGPKRAIDRAAKKLGYSKSDYVVDSYLELYGSDCLMQGRKLGNMVF
ncbi:MAG TPA: class IV adenylate cyclase [Candidatus Acidoferrales bacterium]|nr:class IV adenylate cyclase [Candidatus Acidoferrales bacterium]